MSEDLQPIPDQIHIDMVRKALWSRPDAGASVMVGSGFSRNAPPTHSYIRELPVWKDITEEIANKLYPYNPQPSSLGDPLRLAQEYNTKFGRSELHRLLSELIQDESYNPGDLHSRLLRLPWRDVFTTNWDRLLERASFDVAERAYSVLLDKDQIPLMSQPRIVKLHGSFPAQFPLIITEEDYQTYPKKYAPFVNTVQQAMMETTLCLIGFSGDDPNFLQWLGWVRENLGESAPKIYLAGWLDLSPEGRRKLEEDRGVLAIDLKDHPQAQNWPESLRHQYATEWVLHTLEQGKPYDVTTWPTAPAQQDTGIPDRLQPVVKITSDVPKSHPNVERDTSSPLYQNETLDRIRQVIDVWTHNRRLYPGWLVFPSGQERASLRMHTDAWGPHILGLLQELSCVEQLNAVRELVWRREIILEPITPDIEDAAQQVIDAIDCEKKVIKDSDEKPDNWTEIRETWRTVAFALVADARLDCKKDLFERRLKALGPFSADHPDVAHRMQYERCLWAINSLDFESLNKLLDDWEVENSDSEWMLRKAALLTEAHRYYDSRPLVRQAINLSRQNFSRNADVASASREGWALFSAFGRSSAQATFRRWAELASRRADAFTEKRMIADEIKDSDERREAPSFDLGIVRAGTGFQFSTRGYTRLVAAYKAIRLSEVTGLPPMSNPDSDSGIPMSAASDILRSAADELVVINQELAVRIVLRISLSASDETLQRVMSRPLIATLSDESTIALAEICIQLIDYALPKISSPDPGIRGISWHQKIEVALEALSRLVMRLPADMVNTTLDVAIKCYQAGNIPERLYFWIGDPLGHLLRRSWQSLPKDCRLTRVFDLLSISVPRIADSTIAERFIDPGAFVTAADIPSKRTADNDVQIRDVVDFLIQGLSDTSEARDRFLRRLLPLVIADLLTDDEKANIANILWGDSDPILSNSLGGGSLFDWVYLILPELEEGRADRSFRSKWLTGTAEIDNTDPADYSGGMLIQVGAAISGLRNQGREFVISPDEQYLIVSHIRCVVEILSSENISLDLRLTSRIARIGELASEVTFPEEIAENLLSKIQPMLGSQSDRQDFFTAPVNQMRIAVGFALIPSLAKAMPDQFDSISKWLRMGLASDDDRRAQSAMSSLRIWISASSDDEMQSPPDDIVREVGFIIASRRKNSLADALWCAATVFQTGTDDQRNIMYDSVIRGLEYLAEELRYDREHDESHDVPSLRLICVQLARALVESGFGDDPAVDRWMEIGREDPFPEVRRMAQISEPEEESSSE